MGDVRWTGSSRAGCRAIVRLVAALLVVAVWCSSLSTDMGTRRFYVTTTSGSESLLLSEVRELPEVSQVKKSSLGVSFSGSSLTGFSAVLRLRTALKVCEVLVEGDKIRSPEDLYAFAKGSVNWSDVLSARDNTLKVDSVLGAVSQSLAHSHYTSLTVKNAIVDYFREKTADRPTIDVTSPDVPLLVYLHKESCIIYRVWSGAASLHKRGYRGDVIHKASLRETTAATLLLAAGYSSNSPSTTTLVDPMCGSASIAIEAALLQCDVAPGLIRLEADGTEPSGCNFVDVDQDAYHQALENAKAVDKRRSIKKNNSTKEKTIIANEIDPSALSLATDSARRAGVLDLIDFTLGDCRNLKLPPHAKEGRKFLAVTNPPWAIRLEDGAEESWQSLGEFARNNLVGHTTDKTSCLWVLAGNPALLPYLGLGKPSSFLALNAANVDMRFVQYHATEEGR